MARNKHPEQTYNLILDTASYLFFQKGYDKTSLQDIINQTKLSKGAIYHHFTSKEEIFIKICERIGKENVRILTAIRDDSDLNGQQKLREIFRASVLAIDNQETVFKIMPYLIDSPKFLAIQLKSLFESTVPDFIKPILDEGNADGSLHCENTAELAQAVMLLSDLWLHPMLMPTTEDEMKAKCSVFKLITSSIGLDFLDDEVTDAYVSFCKKFNCSGK